MNMPAAGNRILPAGSALNALDRRATQAMTVGIQGEDCRLGEKTHPVLLDRRPGTDRAGHPAALPAPTRRYVTVLQGEVKPPKAALHAPQDVAEAAQGPGGEEGYVGARSRSVLSAPRHARRRRPVQPRRRPTAPLAQLRPSPSLRIGRSATALRERPQTDVRSAWSSAAPETAATPAESGSSSLIVGYDTDAEGVISESEYTLSKPSSGPNQGPPHRSRCESPASTRLRDRGQPQVA